MDLKPLNEGESWGPDTFSQTPPRAGHKTDAETIRIIARARAPSSISHDWNSFASSLIKKQQRRLSNLFIVFCDATAGGG